MSEPARELEEMPFRVPVRNRYESDALLRDGLARTVIADVLVAVDAPDDAWVRARATQLLVPAQSRDRWVVGFRTAVWIYTGGHGGAPVGADVGEPEQVRPPTCAEVIVLPGQQRPSGPPVRGRQVALAAGEVTELHGLRITTPLRTAADVARDLPAAEAIPMLAALAEVCGIRPPQVLRQLSRMRYARGCAKAKPVVRAWAEE